MVLKVKVKLYGMVSEWCSGGGVGGGANVVLCQCWGEVLHGGGGEVQWDDVCCGGVVMWC